MFLKYWDMAGHEDVISHCVLEDLWERMPRIITICSVGNAIYNLQITLVFVKWSEFHFSCFCQLRADAFISPKLHSRQSQWPESDLTREEHNRDSNDKGLGGAHRRTPSTVCSPWPSVSPDEGGVCSASNTEPFSSYTGIHTGSQGPPTPPLP